MPLMPPTALAKKKSDFDPRKFLATIGNGRRVVAFPKKETIFAQGDAADAVFYIQAGKIRLTVVSKIGKEATRRFQLCRAEIAINAGYNKSAFVPECGHVVTLFWGPLLSIGHAHSFPRPRLDYHPLCISNFTAAEF
jgi:CRP-like cAMP-binding protein